MFSMEQFEMIMMWGNRRDQVCTNMKRSIFIREEQNLPLVQLGIWTNTVFALWTNKFCNLNKYILQFVQIQSNRSSSERGIIFFFDLFNLDFLSSSSPKPLKRSSSSPLHCCSSQALSSPLHYSPSLWVSNNLRCSFWMPLRLDYIQV